MKITELKGIGPKTEALFEKIGVSSVEDLIRDYPAGYDAFEAPVAAGAAVPGAKEAVRLTITRPPAVRNTKKMTILAAEGADLTGKMRLVWFNQPYLAGRLRRGATFIFRGNVSENGNNLQMEQPALYTEDEYEKRSGTLRPVYALTRGLSNKTVVRAAEEALRLAAAEKLPGVSEYLPKTLRGENELAEEGAALHDIHFPKDEDALVRARNRLVFDEFFLFALSVKRLKKLRDSEGSSFQMKETARTDAAEGRLPYHLTGAQTRVWGEVRAGLMGKTAMHRLIQGDVGSGKTVIAFLAMSLTAENGYQSAIMAPTEVLARQHYEKLLRFRNELGLSFLHPVLLTGSLKAAERREALEALSSGRANAAVGTQALIQDTAVYHCLALVITDEQHRFGVNERRALEEKNAAAEKNVCASGDKGAARTVHSLVMSATPIPRTLGVILYADLDISILDERPAKRLPVKSAVVDEKWRPAAMKFIRKEVSAGRQCYVICPMIEPSEELALANVRDEVHSLRKEFPEFTVEGLSGRMRPEEKNAVMEAFTAGKTQILVSTTVVEVGVDVPNATVMMIENAERFGLAALHQLRGRVGRGKYQSYCIFMAGQKSKAIKERLDILGKTADGFAIAEKDFEMRGPGDLLGIRQSGDARFRLADVARDRGLLLSAGKAAEELLRADPELENEENAAVRSTLYAYISRNERNLTL